MQNKKTKVKDLKLSRRAGYYWVDGIPYPSVTSILGVMSKDALQIWYGKCVYRALTANPGLSEADALKAPYMISGQAKTRGTNVHDLTEKFQDTDEYINSLSEEMQGYGKAYRNWLHDFNPQVVIQEQTVFSEKHQFAGTLDMIVKIGDEELIIDKKTGADLYPEVQVQLSAYKQCLEEKGRHVGMGALLLKPDGTYKFERYSNFLIDVFLACKVIYEWRNKKKMDEINKFKKLKQK